MVAVQTAPPAQSTATGAFHDNSLVAQKLSLYLTPAVGVVLLLVFLTFPGFSPPMSPQMTAEQVSQFYADNATQVRFSMILLNLCGPLLLPFFMVIVVQMKRMGNPTPAFAYSYLCAVASGATLVALADLFWLMASFRADRDPELVLLLHDLAWITFSAPVGVVVAQCVLLAMAIYSDKRPVPVLPRWVAHLNVLTALAVLPSAGAAAVQEGPLAWDGAVSFWLRVLAYGSYLAIMFVVVLRAVQQQGREEAGRT